MMPGRIAAVAVTLGVSFAAAMTPAFAEGDNARDWPVFTRGSGPASPTAEEVAAQKPDAGILGLGATATPRNAARAARAERREARRTARQQARKVQPAAEADDAPAESASLGAAPAGGEGGLHALINEHAKRQGVPPALAHAVIRIESRHNPRAANAGNFGLMQIRLQTARGIGYSGGAAGLLDANTNLTYGMKYLAGAHRLAGGDVCGTIMRYQGGHRAERMNGANRAYCAKARAIMAGRSI